MKELGSKIEDFDTKINLRQLIYKKHRIIYYLKEDNVYILTIIHTKMDFYVSLKKALENGGI